MRFSLPTFVCLLLIPFAALAQDVAFPTAPLAIKTQDSTLHFTVEVATTPEQQQHGFMFRKSLPDLHGMIFLFTPPQGVNFWMKDTPLPLDMLFVDEKDTIKRIVKNATPESTDLIPSSGPVKAVIELTGGSADRYHIATGDSIAFSQVP